MAPHSEELRHPEETSDAIAAFRLFRDLPFIGMATNDGETFRWLDVNQTLCDLLGYDRDALLTKSWTDLTHPDELPRDFEELERIVKGESNGYKRDKRLLRADGSVMHASIDVKVVRKPDGRVDRFIAMIADITARVEAERASHEAASLLQNLGHLVPSVIYQFQRFPDGSARFPYASDGLTDVFALSPAAVRHDASAAFDRIHPDDRAYVLETIEQSAASLHTWSCSYRVILPSRGVRWIKGSARPERLPDGSTLWHGYLADSTDEELAREALRESEERYRIQVEHAPEAIVVLDIAKNRFVDGNRNAERLFGLTRDELLEKSVLDVTPEFQENGQPSAAFAFEYIQRALAGEPQLFEWMHRDTSGREFPCEVRLSALPFEGRQLVRGSVSDISERRASLDALTRLRAAIEASLNGVVMADLDGTLTYMNRSFISMWGFDSAERAIGMHALELWDEDQRPTEPFNTLVTTGTWSGELPVRRRGDGTALVVLMNASVFNDSRGVPAGLMASFVDVSAEKRLQAQLGQAQKMESVGRLAGGVAHDFNNLLTVMKGYIELSIASLKPESAVRQDLVEVERAADSAARLTQQLLAFSRKQLIAPVVLDLNEVVRRVHGMLQRLLGEDILLKLVTDDSLALVRFDPGQAEQILVNLAVNARDAMPDGGRLTLETSNVVLDDKYLQEHPDVPPGEYVLLAVSDTGVGMSTEVREHAFEPFFTTKEIGRGTGLGLAMIHGAVSQNGGRVEVYSEPGHGTSFKIYLPRVFDSEMQPLPGTPAELPRGSETILLVEDDDTVRTLAVRLLVRQGYRVFDFADGPSALEWLQNTPEEIALLLTDVIMPLMNGRVLAERVAALRPGTRVLYASGYTSNVIVHHGVLKPGVEFLAKPFTIAALATRVREVIDSASG